MIVRPYTLRPAPPPLALLTEGGGFLDEHGRIFPIGKVEKGVQCWADLASPNSAACKARRWRRAADIYTMYDFLGIIREAEADETSESA